MRVSLAVPLVLLASGCLIPRNGVMGMPATMIGPGGAEVAASTGIIYSTGATHQPVSNTTETVRLEEFQIPLVEANARIGLADFADLNIHAGAGGLEPGLKLGGAAGNWAFAAMPTFGVGYYSLKEAITLDANTGATNNGESTTNYLLVQGGLHLMASHVRGGYLGVKYWFLFTSGKSNNGTGMADTSDVATTAHNVGFNVGWDFPAGPVNIRTEVSFSMQLGVNQSSMGMSQSVDGTTFTLMPSITIAAAKKGGSQAQ